VPRHGHVAVDHRTSRRFGNLCVSVAKAEFTRAARVVAGSSDPPPDWATFAPAPDRFARLVARAWRLVYAGHTGDEPNTTDRSQMEQACLTAVVEALYPATDDRAPPLPVRTALVRRADDFLRARLRDPVGEIDLCEELGISGRTLRLAFRERFGIGPMVYFQTLRLNAARAAIRTAGPTNRGVAAVARAFGFRHPGKFAGYYRRQFGESPSETGGRDRNSPANHWK
jgi:AraC family transcriptional regulator, ethanolamine operon transcriptional activator